MSSKYGFARTILAGARIASVIGILSGVAIPIAGAESMMAMPLFAAGIILVLASMMSLVICVIGEAILDQANSSAQSVHYLQAIAAKMTGDEIITVPESFAPTAPSDVDGNSAMPGTSNGGPRVATGAEGETFNHRGQDIVSRGNRWVWIARDQEFTTLGKAKKAINESVPMPSGATSSPI